MNDLAGRIALVTGASRGIGRAIGLALGRAGAAIAVAYRSRAEQAAAVCGELERAGARTVAVQADVAEGPDVRRLVASVERDLGPIDILVNNAGIGPVRSIEELTEEDWDRTLDTNLKSAFLLTQAVVGGMRARHWGRIINISSTAAQVGGIIGPHYAASKAGLLGLTRAYASRLATDGITVNAVAPALIETDMLAANRAVHPDRIPVGRLGRPEEVAAVVVMLAANAYVTGQAIQVNGGLYLT